MPRDIQYVNFKFRIADSDGKPMAEVERDYPKQAAMMAYAEDLYGLVLQHLQTFGDVAVVDLPQWAKDAERVITQIDTFKG